MQYARPTTWETRIFGGSYWPSLPQRALCFILPPPPGPSGQYKAQGPCCLRGPPGYLLPFEPKVCSEGAWRAERLSKGLCMLLWALWASFNQLHFAPLGLFSCPKGLKAVSRPQSAFSPKVGASFQPFGHILPTAFRQKSVVAPPG